MWSGYISFTWWYYEDEHFTDWEMFPLPNIIKQKACKSTFQAMLIGHAKWEPVRLPKPMQCRIEAGVLAGTNSLCHSPMWRTDWGLWQKPVSAYQRWLLGLWTWEFPFEGHLLPCYLALIEASLMTEGQKMIFKPEIPKTFWVMSEKHSNGDGSAQRSSIIKRNWFI